MLNSSIVRGAPPELVLHIVDLTGTGAADPTKDYGPGVTVTRLGTGRYKVAFSDNQGRFLGCWPTFCKTVPAAGAGQIFTVDKDSLSTSGNSTFEFYVEDPGTDAVAPALADLASTEGVYLFIAYKTTAV